jgi:Multiubiquitin
MAGDDNASGVERHELSINVDGNEFRVPGVVVSGRAVLEAAGKLPPDDFIVYWLGKDNVLEDLGLDRTVHLHERCVERFLTFQADRSFRFEIDGKREDWGCPTITEETLRKLAGADGGFRVWLERKDEPDRLITRGESVDLTAPGIERFYLERVFSVEIVNEENGVEFRLEALKGTKLETLFAEMYVKLGVPRRADDRLRCEETGEDVFGFAHLTLGHYLESGHCPCLVWCFVGGTGGAMCR